MWWQLFIVLVATAAASPDEHEDEDYNPNCESLVYLQCEKDDDSKPDDFPGTEEELEEFCKYALKYFDCAKEVYSKCEGNEVFKQYLRDLSLNVRRVCTEDSLIYAAVAANLPCYKMNEETIATCHRTSNLDIDSFADLLNESGINDIKELGDSGSNRCLNVLFSTGCMAATTGQLCGDEARDVVVNIIQGLDTPFEDCPAGARENLLMIAKVMQAEAEEAESVEETMKEKK